MINYRVLKSEEKAKIVENFLKENEFYFCEIENKTLKEIVEKHITKKESSTK